MMISKKETLNKCKEILNKYEYKGSVSDALNEEDFFYMRQIIKNHPDYIEKRGVGIACMFVGKAPSKDTKCFYVLRHDGTSVDFSYIKCVNKPVSKITLFSKVLRDVVKNQIEEYRQGYIKNNGKFSEISGNKVLGSGHIDHYGELNFNGIVKLFIDTYGINISNISYIKKPDTVIFTDEHKNIAFDFYDFHKQKAKLRFVAPSENLKRKRYDI